MARPIVWSRLCSLLRSPRRLTSSAPTTGALEIELTSDAIDTHQRLARHPPRSLKPVGVIQDLYSLLLAHYAVRASMAEAATQAGLAPTRLRFVHAVELIRLALDDVHLVAPAHHSLLYQRRVPPAPAGAADYSPRWHAHNVQRQAQTRLSPALLPAPCRLSGHHSYPAAPSPRAAHP